MSPLSNTLQIKRIAMTKQRYPIDVEEHSIIDSHPQHRQSMATGSGDMSETSLSKSITKMQMYNQQVSRGQHNKDAITGPIIQIEVQNHAQDEQKPKVSYQPGTGLVIIAGGQQSQSRDFKEFRSTFNSGLSKFHPNDSDEHSSKRLDSQMYDIDKAHEDLKNLDVDSIQMKNSIETAGSNQSPNTSPLRQHLREFQVLRPNNLPFQPKKKQFVNQPPKKGPLNKFIPLQKLKHSPRVGSTNKNSPRNHYYLSRKQIGKQLAINNQPGKQLFVHNVIDLQKISENSPHSNKESSPKIVNHKENSRINFNIDVDQMNILKSEISIQEHHVPQTDRQTKMIKFGSDVIAQKSQASTDRSHFATQDNSPSKDHRGSPFLTQDKNTMNNVQLSGSIEIQQALKKMSRIKIDGQLLSGSIDSSNQNLQQKPIREELKNETTLLEPQIQQSLQQSFISRQGSKNGIIQQSTNHHQPANINKEGSQKKIPTTQHNKVQQAQNSLGPFSGTNAHITMTTIAAQSNECTTPAEEISSPKEKDGLNLKNYEVIPDNIMKFVNSEQLSRVNHQKLQSGFGVISSKDKDQMFNKVASSLVSSQGMLAQSATSDNGNTDTKNLELNTIDEYEQDNIVSNSTFLRISEDFSTQQMQVGFQFQPQANSKGKNKQIKLAVFNDAIKDIKIESKKEQPLENKQIDKFVSFAPLKTKQKPDLFPGYHVHKRVSTSFNSKRFFNARQKKQNPQIHTSMDGAQLGLLAPLGGSNFSGNKTCLSYIPKIAISPEQSVMESQVTQIKSKREAVTADPSARQYSPRNFSYGAGFQRQAKTGLGWMNKRKIKTMPKKQQIGVDNTPELPTLQDSTKREIGQFMEFVKIDDAPTISPNYQLLDKQLEMIRKNMQTFEQAQSGKSPMLSPVMKGKTYIVKEYSIKNDGIIPKLKLNSQKNEPQVNLAYSKRSPIVDKFNSKRVSFSMNANDDIKIYLDEQTSITNNEISQPQTKVIKSKYTHVNEVVEENTNDSKVQSNKISQRQSPSQTERKGQVSQSRMSVESQANISKDNGYKNDIQSSVSQDHLIENSSNVNHFTVNQNSLIETARRTDGEGNGISNLHTIEKAEVTIGQDTINIEQVEDIKNQELQSNQNVEAALQSVGCKQIKQDLDTFEKFRMQDTPLDEIHSKPTSPGAKSYVSSLLGPMSFGNGSPLSKNRIHASPHYPHRFTISKFRINALQSRAISRQAGDVSASNVSKSYDPVSPLLRPVHLNNQHIQMSVLQEHSSQESMGFGSKTRAQRELTKLNFLMEPMMLEKINDYEHHLIASGRNSFFPQKQPSTLMKFDPLRSSIRNQEAERDADHTQKKRSFANNFLKLQYENQQEMQAQVTVKQTRNSYLTSKTDQQKSKHKSDVGELATFGQVNRSPRLQMGPSVLGPSKNQWQLENSIKSPKNAYQGYQNKVKMQRENSLLYKQQKLLKDIRKNSEIQEQLAHQALRTNSLTQNFQ